jgi:integrase
MSSSNVSQHLLLLSRDLRSAGHDLRSDGSGAATPTVEQLELPGIEPPPVRQPRRRTRPVRRHPRQPVADDPLLTAFVRRLAAQGRARQGEQAYARQIRSMLVIAARLTGREMIWAELWQDEALLGRVLVDDTARTRSTRLSRWTLAQRRSAIRDFATLMRPELFRLLADDPHDRLDRALRAVAQRIGGGFRLTGGAPRRRGGRAPSATQIRDVLDIIGRAPGYRGLRNRVFFQILAETGARINALRQLDGTDCVEMPNGRLRIFLHEKSKGEPREVELSREATDGVRAYAEAFNYYAAVRRWGVRVRLGVRLATLRAGCTAAEVVGFTPHALRRAFATDATSVLPRHTVAQAGGWQGLERLDDHYVQPRDGTTRAKLSRQEPDDRPARSEDRSREAAHTP